MPIPAPESPNECWLCTHQNTSNDNSCEVCGGVTPYTRFKGVKVQWTIRTFPPDIDPKSRFGSILGVLRTLDHYEGIAVKIGTGKGAALRKAKDDGTEAAFGDRPRVLPPAVILIKAPRDEMERKNEKEKGDEKGEEKGPITRFSYRLWDEETQKTNVETCQWKDATRPTFWDEVNKALALDETNSRLELAAENLSGTPGHWI
ncbi:hypothetical protein CLCR_04357 [Cladophialophora carrionii]|uniref:RanBP2-type domain-containing protein n=1 Tax=Cladophialophora carrionii TaxID=86049 RepID=A0A1C1CIY2_9EURO|nr:hypothetical protein CLCR_04357 [Cladophialophora carrionii]